jgi:hypothetical protein
MDLQSQEGGVYNMDNVCSLQPHNPVGVKSALHSLGYC